VWATDKDIPFYMLAKAGCYICGKGSNVVSTGVEIEGEGILALCEAHVVEMANFAGYALNDQRHEVRWQEKLDKETGYVEEYRHEASIQAERAKIAEARYEEYRDFVLDTFGERAPEEIEVAAVVGKLVDPVTGKFTKR
jgi:hypothetical protein